MEASITFIHISDQKLYSSCLPLRQLHADPGLEVLQLTAGMISVQLWQHHRADKAFEIFEVLEVFSFFCNLQAEPRVLRFLRFSVSIALTRRLRFLSNGDSGYIQFPHRTPLSCTIAILM